MSTGFLRTLVWYSPGSQAISTLTPRWAYPANDPRAMPGPSPIPPRTPPVQAAQPPPAGGSHTPAFSGVRESSHTQEFARLGPARWPKRRL
jgi:hypothetical protein